MPSIKNNFLYSSFLTTANYIFPLITYPYVSRVLGVTNIGQVNFVDSIIHYFVLVSMLGISTLGIREISSVGDDINRRSKVFSTLIALNTISTTIALVLLVGATLIVPKLYENFDLMMIGAVKLIFNYLLIDWLYRGLEDFKYITTRTLLVKVLYVIAIFVFVKTASDTAVYYLVTVMTIVANSVINCIYSRKFVKWDFRKLSFKGLLKPFFTLGIYMLLTSMYITFNTAYLGFVTDDTQVGYYTTATKLFSIILALFSAFTGVMLPRMSNLLANNKIDEFKTLLKKSDMILTEVSIPVIIFTVIYAQQIILIISGRGYEGAIIPMKIIMPLIFVIGYEQILVIQGLMPMKKDHSILRNTCIAASSSLVLNILLVPHLQAIGSAIVWASSELIIMILSQIVIQKSINFKISFHNIFRTLLMYLPMGVILLATNALLGTSIAVFMAMAVFSSIYFVIVNKYFNKEGIVFGVGQEMLNKFISKIK